MELINVFNAAPGMILARDTVNRDGRHLFDKGISLTPAQIRILKMWGVHEIAVDDIGITPGAAPPAPSREITRFLNRHFKNNDVSNPVIRVVLQECRRRFEADAALFAESQENEISPGKPKDNHVPEKPVDVNALLESDLKLPSLPTIFFEINAASQNPRFSGKDIADIVSKDPSLSATLLRIINSAFYGFSEPVESLPYAAMALGSRQVCFLALGITVINYFKGMPSGSINMDSFWRHSVACGITAQTLASHVKGVNGERLFIGGLLHDIGRLVFYSAYPDASVTAFAQTGKLKLMLYQVEPKYFGVTHARFGALLAKKWNFSLDIAKLVAHHHDNFKAKPDREVAAVYFANWLVNALRIGSAGDLYLPKLNMAAWQALEFSPSGLAHVIRQVDRQTTEAVRFFYE